MNAIRKLALILGVAFLATAVLSAPVEAGKQKQSKPKTKKRPKKVSQTISWSQAMQPPGCFEKEKSRRLEPFNRIEIAKVLPTNEKGHFKADVRVTAFTSLGTDSFTFDYPTEFAMISENQVRNQVPAKRGRIVWTPLGRAIRWTAYLPDLDMKNRPDDLKRIGYGFKFLWERSEKKVDGRTVPAEAIWSRNIIFLSYDLALDHYPGFTRQMGS